MLFVAKVNDCIGIASDYLLDNVRVVIELWLCEDLREVFLIFASDSLHAEEVLDVPNPDVLVRLPYEDWIEKFFFCNSDALFDIHNVLVKYLLEELVSLRLI